LQCWLVELGNVTQQPECEIAPKDRADLRDFTCFSQPIKACGKRLL
jgi:hypothetical protein